MNWKLLKENKCPKCEKDLISGLETQIMKNGDKLLLHPCGFKIRERRYSEIVNNQVTANIEDRLNKEFEDF